LKSAEAEGARRVPAVTSVVPEVFAQLNAWDKGDYLIYAQDQGKIDPIATLFKSFVNSDRLLQRSDNAG
jgi:hypothetical protein